MPRAWLPAVTYSGALALCAAWVPGAHPVLTHCPLPALPPPSQEVTLGPGTYGIEETAFWSERVYSHVFRLLNEYNVVLDAILLKPNMCLPGGGERADARKRMHDGMVVLLCAGLLMRRCHAAQHVLASCAWCQAADYAHVVALLHCALRRCCVCMYSCCVSMHSCCVSMYSCCVSMHSCCVSMHSCCVSMHSCCVSMYSCCVSMYSCCVSMHSCCVSMHSCCCASSRCCALLAMPCHGV